MSKSKSKRGRVNTSNANQRLHPRTPVKVSPDGGLGQYRKWLKTYTASKKLREVEDRREYHPQGKARPARQLNARRVTLVQQSQKPNRNARKRPSRSLWANIMGPIAFAQPSRVAVCIRRSVRREVMHAIKKTGGRGGKQRRPRFSEFSKISCRRKK